MTALATSEASRLADLEAAVERGLATFLEVGEALREIHDSRLYRGNHDSFEAYCRDRWGFTDRRGRQLMEAAEIGTVVPVKNEAQARELARLRANPDRMASAWGEASERARGEDRPVTAGDVRAAVAARMPRPTPAASRSKLGSNGDVASSPAPSPPERIARFVDGCRRLAQVAETLDIESVARSGPRDADAWRDAFSVARDALDMLIERTQKAAGEALTDPEMTAIAAEADQLGIELRRA